MIGLELMLLVKDPFQIFATTDHPNFNNYEMGEYYTPYFFFFYLLNSYFNYDEFPK